MKLFLYILIGAFVQMTVAAAVVMIRRWRDYQFLQKRMAGLEVDSVEPAEVDRNLAWGAVGATSNPAIISGIVKEGGLDRSIESLLAAGHDDEGVAWALTDQLVIDAQKKFLPVHQQTGGNAGWVSFELDPILEAPDVGLSDAERTEAYITGRFG